MTRSIRFYFDYLSPYSYLAWKQLEERFQSVKVTFEYAPVLLAGLLNHWEQKGPAEIPPKRTYIFKHTFRYAAKRGIPFTLPKYHPFNPLLSLRLSLPETCGSLQFQVIDALWKGGWEQGRDLGDEKEIGSILEDHGLNSVLLIEKTRQQEIKDILKNRTAEALQKGVFGVPTFMVDQTELFWGNDSVEDLLLYLEGKDPLDRKQLEQALARGGSAQRKPPQ